MLYSLTQRLPTNILNHPSINHAVSPSNKVNSPKIMHITLSTAQLVEKITFKICVLIPFLHLGNDQK